MAKLKLQAQLSSVQDQFHNFTERFTISQITGFWLSSGSNDNARATDKVARKGVSKGFSAALGPSEGAPVRDSKDLETAETRGRSQVGCAIPKVMKPSRKYEQVNQTAIPNIGENRTCLYTKRQPGSDFRGSVSTYSVCMWLCSCPQDPQESMFSL